MAPDRMLGDWNEYGRLVLKEIEELHDEVKGLIRKVDRIEQKVTRLEVKMALIGAGAAAVTSAAVTWLFNLLKP
jgi:hypothetical protein